MSKSVDFWYFLISRTATVPGLNLCGFLMPPVGAVFLAVLEVISFLGFLTPAADFLAVVLVLAILNSKLDLGLILGTRPDMVFGNCIG